LLTTMPNFIDIEEIAKHRGSAFGERVCGQPTQINFENQLSIAFLKQLHAARNATILLEDEGDFVGSVAVPQCLRTAMFQAPMILLESTLEERVERTFDGYVRQLHQEFCEVYLEEGDARYATFWRERMVRIKRRLGGTRYQAYSDQLESALSSWIEQRREDEFRVLLQMLLKDYYDPMYRYQLEQKKERVLFQGDRAAIIDWMQEYQCKPVIPAKAGIHGNLKMDPGFRRDDKL